MIPLIQGSSLSQDSSINMTPWDNCHISGYEGPNEISQDFPDRSRTIIYVVKVPDLENETMTRGSPYNFPMLSSPETSHIGKMLISPNW